jgi:hypothetical protein
MFGAAPSAVLSGMLADIWTPKQRGFAMPAAATFLSIGPILGPIVRSSDPQYYHIEANKAVDRFHHRPKSVRMEMD